MSKRSKIYYYNDHSLAFEENPASQYPFLFKEADHSGLDFVAPVSTEVYATGEGIVTLLNFSRTGYGNELVINHRFGYSTRYAHPEKFFVSLYYSNDLTDNEFNLLTNTN